MFFYKDKDDVDVAWSIRRDSVPASAPDNIAVKHRIPSNEYASIHFGYPYSYSFHSWICGNLYVHTKKKPPIIIRAATDSSGA